MAYYLAVETTQSSFEAINFKKTERFKKMFGEQKGYEGTLEEIDKFTTEFADQANLYNNLNGDKVLAWCYYNHPMSIIYVNGVEVRKVPGNLLYADSKKYIENPNLVIEYIVNKAEENDASFFRKLSLILPENNITTYMISVLATSIEDRIIKETKNDVSLINKLKMLLNRKKEDELIDNIAKSLVQFCYLDGEGKLNFSDTIDYEKFHYTVSFISEYEQELTKEHSSELKKVRTKNTPR